MGVAMAGAGAGTGGPSTGTKATAAALDVITMPIQAPVAATSLVANSVTKSKPTATKDKLVEIRRNPELLFSQRSSLSRDTIRAAVIDGSIPFTYEQFHRLGGKREWTRLYLAANPRCPMDLLEEFWQGLAEMSEKERPTMAHCLASNPNSPDVWLEAMTHISTLDTRTRQNTQAILDYRKLGHSKASTKPATPTPTAKQ